MFKRQGNSETPKASAGVQKVLTPKPKILFKSQI